MLAEVNNQTPGDFGGSFLVKGLVNSVMVSLCT